MNGNAVIDLLVARLGDRTDLRVAILLEMTLVQQTLLEGGDELPWFLLSDDQPLTIVASNRNVAVPSDFLREHEEGELLVTNSTGVETALEKAAYDELIDFYGFDALADPPTAYALVGDNFALFPIPSVVRALTLSKYYKRAAAPTDTAAENAWLKWASDLLIAETGIVMAGQYLQNDAMASLFVGMQAVAKRRLNTQNVAREEANRARNMGAN